MQNRGLAVPGYRDLYPVALATGVADETDHRLAVLIDHVAARAAAVEIARLVAELDADLVGIGGRFVRMVIRGQKQLHRADFLLRMLRQMTRIIAAHEAGGGLLADRAAEYFCVEGPGFCVANAVVGMGGERQDKRCDQGQGGNEFHGNPLECSWHAIAATGCRR